MVDKYEQPTEMATEGDAGLFGITSSEQDELRRRFKEGVLLSRNRVIQEKIHMT